MTRWILTLMWFVIPVSLISLNAQSSEDNPITLEITAENRASINYVVDTDAEYITIQVQAVDSDVFDPVLWVVNSTNQLIAYNDDLNEDSIAIIENLFLQLDTYTIWIDSFNGVSDGEVEVTIESVDPFNAVSTTDGNTISVNATLIEDTPYHYALELSENDAVTITVRDISHTLDPYLSIIDKDGTIHIANDDHQSTDMSLNRLDSFISQWQAPTDGIYTIEVRDFLGNAGQFELSITLISE